MRGSNVQAKGMMLATLDYIVLAICQTTLKAQLFRKPYFNYPSPSLPF